MPWTRGLLGSLSLGMCRVCGWAGKYLPEWPSRTVTILPVFMSQSFALGTGWFCHHLLLTASASCLPALKAACCDGQQGSMATVGHCGTSPLPSRGLREVVFCEDSPASFHSSSCAMSHLGSGTGLLVSALCGAPASGHQGYCLASWMLDFSLSLTSF